jgi:AcrR family transcriptional regulator
MPLSRERVLRAAVELADSSGLAALSMRRLAQELGVEAMTLYHYVANKREMLEGMIDIVEGEIELPAADTDWKSGLRATATSAHDAYTRHPWASGLALSSGRLTPSRLRYMESVLGTLRRGGFTPHQAHLGYHALESHIIGFTLWLAGMSLPDDLSDLATSVLNEVSAEENPYFVEHIGEHLEPTETDIGAFAFGLELILDGLERLPGSRPSADASPRVANAGANGPVS